MSKQSDGKKECKFIVVAKTGGKNKLWSVTKLRIYFTVLRFLEAQDKLIPGTCRYLSGYQNRMSH